MRLYLGLGVLAAAVVMAVYLQSGGEQSMSGSADNATQPEMIAVNLPVLEGETLIGAQAFAVKCAACHGPNAGGIEGSGPPLIHKIYEPGHHGDMSFVMAARRGVQSHHWRFGNMPPVEAITDAEIKTIIAFVRAVQHENGIF